MTSPFIPVINVEDLNSLDPDEIVAGYRAGLAGEDEPGHNRGRAFWHGWRYGMIDSGRMQKDTPAITLAISLARFKRGK